MTDNELYEAIVLTIAGPMTSNVLVNVRHVNETNYIRATAEGASETDRALYTPQAIAHFEVIAMQDNALSIARWAQAIYLSVRNQKEQINAIANARRQFQSTTDTINHLKTELEQIQTGRSYPTLSSEERQRQAEATAQALQRAKEDLVAHAQALRDLQQGDLPAATASQQGPGEVPPGHVHLDCRLSNLS